MLTIHRVWRGFTLTELLVVVIIIMFLAALLFPVFSLANASARRSSCATNLKELAQGVELYRQEGSGYPLAPNYVGTGGVPQGGMTGLTLINNTLSAASLWCLDDKYPASLPGGSSPASVLAQAGMLQDNTSSTYNFGYNYYGYVTTTNNTPFPITTQQAFCYFMGNPCVLDATLAVNQQWNLGSVRTNDPTKQASYDATTNVAPHTNPGLTAGDLHPAGLAQCLANTWAPANTVIGFCPNHVTTTTQNLLPVVLLSGETQMVATKYAPYPSVTLSQPFYRGINPLDPPQYLIDWRLDRTLVTTNGAYNNTTLGDAPYATTAVAMPVVNVNYFTISVNTALPGRPSGSIPACRCCSMIS